jgi:virginiamycin A acetyltransferase
MQPVASTDSLSATGVISMSKATLLSTPGIPDGQSLYPMPDNPNLIFLLPLLLLRPQLAGRYEVGEFTYYSDFNDPLDFFEKSVLYDFGILKSKLIIGKYCALAHGCRFIMADANHAISGPSTYPFPGSWSDRLDVSEVPLPIKGDTVVGHDVWIGYGAVVMPGVQVGDGAVIGALSVVASDIPAYCIAAGNPARVIRQRFSVNDVARLRALAWWHWPRQWVLEAVPDLIRGDLATIEAFAGSRAIGGINAR